MKKAFRNLNLLRSFECAARHNSYSIAAEELCISQAAISQHMRQLENVLACKLFVRKDKRMELTGKGETLYGAVKQAFGLLRKGINDVSKDGVEEGLVVTSTPAFTTLWLIPRLHKFLAQHPDIKVNLVSSAKFENIEQEHIDLAIRFGNSAFSNTNDRLTCEFFGEANVYPICSAMLAKNLNMTKPADLLTTWLVTLENPGDYDWPSWFEHAHVKGHVTHTLWTKVQSTDMALSAVLSDHGATLATKYLCEKQLSAGQLIIPFDIPHPHTVKRYLVFDPHSVKLKRLNIFMQWLKAEMAASDQ